MYGLDVVSNWSTGDTVEINGESQQILSWYTGGVAGKDEFDRVRFHHYVVTLVIVPWDGIKISDFRIYHYENEEFVLVHQGDIVGAIQPGKYI